MHVDGYPLQVHGYPLFVCFLRLEPTTCKGIMNRLQFTHATLNLPYQALLVHVA